MEEKVKELLRASTAPEGHRVPDGLLDENAFRTCFNESCKRSNIKAKRRQMALYTNFDSSCDSIINISEGIDRHAPYNGRPESLVWKISLAALEVSTFANGHNISDRFIGRTPTWGGL